MFKKNGPTHGGYKRKFLRKVHKSKLNAFESNAMLTRFAFIAKTKKTRLWSSVYKEVRITGWYSEVVKCSPLELEVSSSPPGRVVFFITIFNF